MNEVDIYLPTELFSRIYKLSQGKNTVFSCLTEESQQLTLSVQKSLSEIRLRYTADAFTVNNHGVLQICVNEFSFGNEKPEAKRKPGRKPKQVGNNDVEKSRPTKSSDLELQSQVDFTYKNYATKKMTDVFIGEILDRYMENFDPPDMTEEEFDLKSSEVSESMIDGDKRLVDYFSPKLIGDITVYQCQLCQAGVLSLRRFYFHLRDCHGGFRPWHCDQCEYKTTFPALLKRHQRVHENLDDAVQSSAGSQTEQKRAQRKRALEEDTDDPDWSPRIETENVASKSVPKKIAKTIPKKKASASKRKLPKMSTTKSKPISKAKSKEKTAEPEVREATIEIIPIEDILLDDDALKGQSFVSQFDSTQKFDSVIDITNETESSPNVDGVDTRLYKMCKNYWFLISDYCDLDNGSFQCKTCPKQFTKRARFMDHLLKEHRDCQPYRCLKCNFKTRGKSNVFSHNIYKHSKEEESRFHCQICDKKFLMKNKYNQHMLGHKNERKFKCADCEGSFNREHDLREHRKRIHSTHEMFVCHCGKKFKYVNSLKNHQHVHTPGRLFKCTYCQKPYRSAASLRIHMHSHTTVFHCQICDKNIYSYSAFIVHKNLHDPRARKHVCDTCGKSFPSSKLLNKHIMVKHNDDDTDGFQCQECGKTFRLKQQLEAHSACHSDQKPWQCEICGAAFKRQSSLCVHRKQHGPSHFPPFICSFCHREYKSYRELALHLATEEQAGLCTLCDRLFSSRPLLDQHMISAHQTVRIMPTQLNATIDGVVVQEQKDDMPQTIDAVRSIRDDGVPEIIISTRHLKHYPSVNSSHTVVIDASNPAGGITGEIPVPVEVIDPSCTVHGDILPPQ